LSDLAVIYFDAAVIPVTNSENRLCQKAAGVIIAAVFAVLVSLT
jgi:hypothetical protein